MKHVAIAVVIVVATGGAAHADRAAADAVWQKVTASRDAHLALTCAADYMAVYNADPNGPGSDDVLTNAAECYEIAHSIGAAIMTLNLVIKSFPSSKDVGKAEPRLGRLYALAGHHDEAAAHLETYAKRFAGEKDAHDMLARAIELRLAFGPPDKALADADYYTRTFGAKQPEEAARLALAVADDKQGAALIAHLQQILTRKPDPDTELVVRARLGAELWKGACGITELEGLCVKLPATYAGRIKTKPKRDRHALPLRCVDWAPPVVVVARDATKAAAARDALAAAVKLGEGRAPQTPAATAALGRARVLLGDAALEADLAVGFPTKLNFSPKTKADSLKRFNAFIQERSKKGEDAQRAYEAVFQTKDADSSIAAAERMGRLSLAFADTMSGAEIPADVRTGEFADDKVDAFCDQMAVVAEPLEKRAVDAFRTCTQKATQLAIDSGPARACTRELGRLAPQDNTLAGMIVPPLARPLVIEAEGPPAVAVPTAEYTAAMAAFAAEDARGWPAAPKCKEVAERFAKGAKAPLVPESFYMAALALHRCGLLDLARDRYAQVLRARPDMPEALANLAELDWRAGKPTEATAGWSAALTADAKQYAARLDRAAMKVVQLRALASADPKSRALYDDILYDLQSAMAVDPERGAAQAALAVLASERAGREAAFYAREAQALGRTGPSGVLALGVLAAQRGDLRLALDDLGRAAAHAETADAAHLALAHVHLQLRRADSALDELAKIKVLGTDGVIARALAQHAVAKDAAAIAGLEAVLAAEPARLDAAFDLAIVFEAKGTAADFARAQRLFTDAGAAKDPALAAEARARAAIVVREIAALATMTATPPPTAPKP